MTEIESHFPFNPSGYEQQCSIEEAISSLEEEPVHPNNSNGWETRLMEIESDLFMDLTSSVNVPQNDVVLMEGMSNRRLPSLLINGAEAIEAENWMLCSSVIDELTQITIDHAKRSSLSSSPIERLSGFFTQGLINKKNQINFNGVDQNQHSEGSSVSSSPAFHILQELSPYIKFGHFAANQAILEATVDNRSIHVVDFDINEGLQWPPLMADLVAAAGSFSILDPPASFKLTALILPTANTNESTVHQTGRRLKEYADSINLTFEFDAIHMGELDTIQVDPGRALITNCMIHQLHSPNRNFTLVNTFLTSSVMLSPRLVVLVEEELFNFSKIIPTTSFSEFFCEAIDHYSAISESLAADGIGRKGLEMIEKDVLGMRIVNSLMQFEKLGCGGGFDLLKSEFKAMAFSSCNVSQANYLVSLFSGGYWVQHERCRLALCWKSRALATTSIWVPKCERRRKSLI
ncbi:Protein NODULATION SIGNALING PATHWAY 2 [Linum perenne]